VTLLDTYLLDCAASCYLQAGEIADAARCYDDAGSYRRAADLYTQLGLHQDAANAYERAKLRDLAAWHLAHRGDGAAEARKMVLADTGRAGQHSLRSMDSWSADPAMPHRLILARCDIAEGRPTTTALQVLADACEYLAGPASRISPYVETWAVALAESMGRDDLVALVFGAAVRGRRLGAAERWDDWARAVLGHDLVLPPGTVFHRPAGT
jgi:tetratricopeptide (TPR) repeat protein